MKYVLTALAVLGLLGTCFGFALSGVSTKPLTRNGQQQAAQKRMKEVAEAVEARKNGDLVPVARCDDPAHHFGLMDPLTVGKHTFVIKNEGKAPLAIRGTGSSCKCTLSDLKDAVIPPGKSYDVTLTWNSGHAKEQFAQTATVETNDPLVREIKLEVKGEVRAVVASLTDTINLGRLTPSNSKSKQFVVYSQVWKTMDIERIESTNPHVTAIVDTEPYQDSFARDSEFNTATTHRVVKVLYDGEAPHGELTGVLRIHVRPPADWSAEQQAVATERIEKIKNGQEVEFATSDGPQFAFPVEADGSILAEVGFHGQVVRRLSLYGKTLRGETIKLGNLKSKETLGTTWTLVGKIRGDKKAAEINATATGIPGLEATVDILPSSNAAEQSFRISLKLTERLKSGIFDRGQAGELSVSAPGIPGDEQLELPINLVVFE
ncbi:MAG TPA: hypothetical protein DDW52_19130 [Planctomycetaceae bacterium]|nr:hypothetical protein [Planctomycetaceae bacterium]